MEKSAPVILLLETKGNYLESAFRLLFSFCVRVEVLQNSRQAWKSLFGSEHSLIPDLVILPFRLDDRGTTGLVGKMRLEEDTREIPVIALVDSPVERELFRQLNLPLSFPFVTPLTLANLVRVFPALRDLSSGSKHLRPNQSIITMSA